MFVRFDDLDDYKRRVWRHGFGIPGMDQSP